MRKAIARGRLLPQSLSTDRRIGRLSLKAALLFPLMWVNCDDQGRLSGDPEEIKYAVCPNIDHITKPDIPELLKELETQELIKAYSTSKTKAIQMLDWWDVHKLQWAYPSQYPPPEGWQDRLRYHATPTQIVTENWLPPSQLGSPPPSALQSDRESTKEIIENKEEKEDGKRRGRGNIPSALGSTSPSSAAILDRLKHCYESGWGFKTTARTSAQFRDLAEELSAAGCALDYIDEAFKEAADMNKLGSSYVKKILFAWLGVARGPPK